MGFKKDFRDAYYDGVIDFAHGEPENHPESQYGMTEDHLRVAREQGYRDAKGKRTIRPENWSEYAVRFRIEVHESGRLDG
jgi:hypothetical protein